VVVEKREEESRAVRKGRDGGGVCRFAKVRVSFGDTVVESILLGSCRKYKRGGSDTVREVCLWV